MPDRSFFLFGPRGAGKSTWLKSKLSKAVYIDLLDTSLFLTLSQTPGKLASLIKPDADWVVIDEVQKIPALLDEVHRLMESSHLRFALSGSSARKLKRSGANLLGGRAVTRNLSGFTAYELGDSFDLQFSLEWGMIPWVQTDRKNSTEILSAYLDTYLKEEIRQEGLVRSLPPFIRFLNVAGFLNGQVVNMANIARDAELPRASVENYFGILEDTLLSRMLPAYSHKGKVRLSAHPKFYWFDSGVARAAAGWLKDPIDSVWKGFALETLILNELTVYNHVSGADRKIAYYRTHTGLEIDFVIETRKATQHSPAEIVGIEIKSSNKWDRAWEKGLRSISEESETKLIKKIGVYTGDRSLYFDDMQVLSVQEFIRQLHAGEIFSKVLDTKH